MTSINKRKATDEIDLTQLPSDNKDDDRKAKDEIDLSQLPSDEDDNDKDTKSLGKRKPKDEIDLTLPSDEDEDDDKDTKSLGKGKAKDEIDLTQLPTSDEDDEKDTESLGSVEILGTAAVAALPPAAKAAVSTATRASSSKNDHDLAMALAAKEKCSQFTPAENRRRRKKRPFECMICLEDGLPGFQGYTLACKHRFCMPCLTEMIRSSLSGPTISSNRTKIVCPEQKCKRNFSLPDIQYILQGNPALFQRYASVADLSYLESQVQDEKSDTRRCPAEHCNYIFVFSPGTGAEGRPFKCPDCKASFCLQCGANNGKVGPAHPNLMCAERRQQLEQEAEERRKFEQWKTENSQADARFNDMLQNEERQGKTLPCPKCKVAITKNGGCSHMHCTACNTSFNWGEEPRR